MHIYGFFFHSITFDSGSSIHTVGLSCFQTWTFKHYLKLRCGRQPWECLWLPTTIAFVSRPTGANCLCHKFLEQTHRLFCIDAQLCLHKQDLFAQTHGSIRTNTTLVHADSPPCLRGHHPPSAQSPTSIHVNNPSHPHRHQLYLCK
jgi:hypothetical protein